MFATWTQMKMSDQMVKAQLAGVTLVSYLADSSPISWFTMGRPTSEEKHNMGTG